MKDVIPKQRIIKELTYNIVLEETILELIATENFTKNELLTYFNNESKIDDKIRELFFTNKIVIQSDDILKPLKPFNHHYFLCDIPCFTCGLLDRCAINNPISPTDCHTFNYWVLFEKGVKRYKTVEYEDDNIVEKEIPKETTD